MFRVRLFLEFTPPPGHSYNILCHEPPCLSLHLTVFPDYGAELLSYILFGDSGLVFPCRNSPILDLQAWFVACCLYSPFTV